MGETMTALDEEDQIIAPPDREWYSVDELAKRWGMKGSWVRDHATRKHPLIRSRRFGRFLRFHRSDVTEFEDRILKNHGQCA